MEQQTRRGRATRRMRVRAVLAAVCAGLLAMTTTSGAAAVLGPDNVPTSTTTGTATVTVTFVDEHGWPLSGLTFDETWYVLPDGSDASTGEHTSNRAGKVTWRLTAGTNDETGRLTVTMTDEWNVSGAERTYTLPSVKAGDARVLRATVRVQGTGSTRARTAVKTSSKAAVKAAYAKLRRNVRTEKPVKVSGCKVAATPKALQKRFLGATNYVRSMVGVANVKLDAKLSSQASKAALIQYRQGYLDHFPTKKKGVCWTNAGAAASGASNLSYGAIGAMNVLQYVDDRGEHNAAVGHRRWIMNPRATSFGTGYAGSFNAMHVTAPGSLTNPTPLWIRWPSAGYFPVEVEPDGRWSFMTTRSDVSFAKAKVAVTVGTKKLRTSVIYRDPAPRAGWQRIQGYQWGMTWTVKNLPKVSGKKVVTAKVRVTGLTLRDGTKLPPVTYSVKLFRAGA